MAEAEVDTTHVRVGDKLGVKKIKVNHQPVTESSSSLHPVKVKDQKVTDAWECDLLSWVSKVKPEKDAAGGNWQH